MKLPLYCGNQITRVELGSNAKTLPIEHFKDMGMPTDKPLGTQLLERAVHMNRRKAHCVPDVCLCHREFAWPDLGRADDLQPGG